MLTIVTCWYQHPELAEDYVAAVEDDLEEGDEVIVIDNGDAPRLPLHFRIIDVGDNIGFVEGSNAGLRRAQNERVLFLNNDIKLGRRGWLDLIRQALEPGVLVGPMRSNYHSHVDARPMPYLDGWCLAGYRDELLELGGFDAGLKEPAYYSDNILCMEARAAGMTLRDAHVPLVHKANATAGPAGTPAVEAASAHNRVRYLSRARALLVAA